jgi:hypothetical protein
MYGFGATEEKLEFGVGSADHFKLGGFEGRRLAKNPRSDTGFEVFVRDCVKVFHNTERVIFFSTQSRKGRGGNAKRRDGFTIDDFGFSN